MTAYGSVILYAGCVAVQGRGLLIMGPSGSGKSALTLHLLALGAELVSDDRTELWAVADRLLARPPETLKGLIEARGIGILQVPHLDQCEITLVTDLSETETERLPPQRSVTLLGLQRPLVLGSRHNHFPASILCYLTGSRYA